MIGSVLLERRSLPIWSLLCLLGAVASIAVGIAERELGWAIFALLPALVGVSMLIVRPTRFHAELTANELLVHPAGESHPYDEMSQVVFVGTAPRKNRGKVHVIHQRGELTIPETCNVPALDVYYFLRGKALPDSNLDVHPAIRDYHRSQSDTFGADRVWTHQARLPTIKACPSTGRYVWLALLITVIAWIGVAATLNQPGWMIAAILLGALTPVAWALGARRSESTYRLNDPGWLAVAILFAPLGLIVYAANRSSTSRWAKKFQDSSLVISPLGVALAQGDLQGQLRWAEVRRVRLRKGASVRSTSVELSVEGAKINILDVYESPLSEIHRQIEHYWKAG